MKTISNFFFTMIVISMAAALIGLVDRPLAATTSAPPSTNSVPVVVTNTPLSVQGNVGVSGNVGLTGTPAVTVSNTASAPVPVQTAAASATTHMGQLPSSHVTLAYLVNCLCFRREGADGTIDPNAFTIPAGQVFVLTNVDWSETGISSRAGQTAILLLEVNHTVIFDSRGIFSTDLLAGKNEQIAGGIVLSVVPQISVFDDTNNVILAGYLMPAS